LGLALQTCCCLVTLAATDRHQGVAELADADLPAEVHEAFRVARHFDAIAGDSSTPPASTSIPVMTLPRDDISELSMNPLEAAEKRALRGTFLGAAGPSSAGTSGAGVKEKGTPSKSEKKAKPSSTPPPPKFSRGTMLRSRGTMLLTDWISMSKSEDHLKIFEQRAADYAADLQGPIREESLIQTGASARSAWGGRRRRGFPDPGEQQKRPGWQVRYPGIEEKVEMANYLLKKSDERKMVEYNPKPKSLIQKKPKAVPKRLEFAPTYTGCYKDGKDSQVLKHAKGAGRGGSGVGLRSVMGGLRPSNMEPVECAIRCKGYKLMGLQTIGHTTFCYCGSSAGKAELAAFDDCNMPCAGNPGLNCGSPLRVSIYELKDTDQPCWGGLRIRGHDTTKKWHQSKPCTSCITAVPTKEKWQTWGDKMHTASFASCLSCEADDAFVMVDPKKRNGFCREYNPHVNKLVTTTYPFYAHWDGAPDFVHTKFMRKYTVPKVRRGKAAAVCRLWKQVLCKPRKAAKMKAWEQEFGKTRSMGHKPHSVHRFLECSVSKVVKCEKVCVAKQQNLGVHPESTSVSCGVGGVDVAVSDAGLKAHLGLRKKGLEGFWCCYTGCQVPPEHSTYREDGSFWCKDEMLSW